VRKLGKSGDGYKLSSLSSSRNGKSNHGTFATIKGNSTGSEENILQNSPENSIVKSVTYSVKVESE